MGFNPTLLSLQDEFHPFIVVLGLGAGFGVSSRSWCRIWGPYECRILGLTPTLLSLQDEFHSFIEALGMGIPSCTPNSVISLILG